MTYLSPELGAIRNKDADRAMIEAAMACFTGQVEVIGQVVRPEQKNDWRTDLTLTNSRPSGNVAAVEAQLTERIRDLVHKGAGITAIKMKLGIDTRRIKRLAAAAGIEIPKVYAKTTIGQAARDKAQEIASARRKANAKRVEPLAAQGLSIRTMAERLTLSRRNIMSLIDEFKIERGPKREDA